MTVQIEFGTVDGDPELGTTTNGGVTVVPVRIFEGRTLTEDIEDGEAQGDVLLVQIGGPFWDVPTKGTRVVIAIPHEHRSLPGAGVILKTLGPSPTTGFGTGDSQLEAQGRNIFAGDGTAVALAKAAAISALQSIFSSWTPVPNDGGAALKALLTTWVATNYATTKLKGT